MKKFINVSTGEEVAFVTSNEGFAVRDHSGRWWTYATMRAISWESLLYRFKESEGGVLLATFSDLQASSLSYADMVMSLDTGVKYMVVNR